MKIGIIGTGKMGGTLAKLWTQKGHQVYLGSRDPQKAQDQAAAVGATGVGLNEAVSQGEVIVLAIPWHAALDTVKSLSFEGQVLIDLTNPIAPGMTLAVGHTTSAGEEIAKAAPGARVVKALNGIHFGALQNPSYNGEIPTAFYCGDDAPAKQQVRALIADLGLDGEDVGPLSYARYLEPLGMLWITMAFAQGRGDTFNFKMIRRGS